MTLKEIFKKHGYPSADWTEDQRTAFENDLDAYEAEMRSKAGNKPPDRREDGNRRDEPTSVQTDPEIRQAIDELQSGMTTLADSLKKVTDHVTQEQQSRQQQEAAAQRKRYEEHVGTLLKEGRVTKADHDELLKDEAVEKNLKALDVFIESSSKWAVDPTLAKKTDGKPEVKDKVGDGGGDDAAQVKNDALAELRLMS